MTYKNFTSILLNLEYSYLTLPKLFYYLTPFSVISKPNAFLINEELMQAIGMDIQDSSTIATILQDKNVFSKIPTFAQAYAGHQFGHFTMLGDGRALVLGEYVSSENLRYDIQLKGSGQTIFSRRGDGKATLKAMLREYLISEAIHFLNIPSSRSLAIIKTNEKVYREEMKEGAILFRMMQSHLRIGTFEYARQWGTLEDLKTLTDYTINRHFPGIEQNSNPALYLLEKVMLGQINLIADWMRVGFIHGVMNTDNTSIGCETFDYGPCSFMNVYHPQSVFSSIDTNARYAFANQPKIIKWNLIKLAESLLPIIHSNSQQAIELAQAIIDQFDGLWKQKYYEIMLKKIGIEKRFNHDEILIDELFALMQKNECDFTNTFIGLLNEIELDHNPILNPSFNEWLEKWKQRVFQNETNFEQSKLIMQKNNPVFIPRNHLVEEALNNAENGNLDLFNQLLKALKTPYNYDSTFHSFLNPPSTHFDKTYKTFCGT